MMTSEQRLDRLERIAKLFVRAGLRARRGMWEQDEKVNIIINNQIANDERFAQLAQSMGELGGEMAKSYNLLAQSQLELAAAQIHTAKNLDSLIEIVGQGRNGNSN